MRIIRIPVRRLLVGATVLAMLAGCGEQDECPTVGVRCDGKIAESCLSQWDNELQRHNVLSRKDCGTGFCKTPPHGANGPAFCSLDALPDSRTPEPLRTLLSSKRCVDGELVTWSFGYRVETSACSYPQTCVDVSSPGFDPSCIGAAFCSTMPSVDPLCDGKTTTSCADSTTIVHCSCNYRLDAHACTSPGPHCVEEKASGTDLIGGVCRP